VVKDAVEIGEKNAKFAPLEGKLFSELATKAIYNKEISYDLNEQAQNFAEMFGITLNRYTIDNYKINSCFMNIIVDTWHSAFEKRKKDGKRMYAELTYKSVCKIINLTYKNQDIGVSLNESKTFFEKFGLGIDVVNVYGEMIFTYRPVNREQNKDIFPSILRVLMHNNHLYPLDKNCKSRLDKLRQKAKEANLEQKLNEDDITTLFVSNKYKLRKPVLDGCEVHFINNLDECVELVKQCKTEKIKFITNNNLTGILFEMIDYNYTPAISFGGMNILSLGFKVGKIYASIENSDNTAPEDTLIHLEGKALYEEYHKADDQFYHGILQECLKSNYNDKVLEIENKYPLGPTSGYLTDKYDERAIYNAIDTNKAYPDCLRKIPIVPVFGYFDEYKEYDNHIIEPYTMYLVEVQNVEASKAILFPTVYHRCFGFKLLHCTDINYKIHAFRRPSDLEEVDFQEPMNQLFNNDKLSSLHKKFIANKTTGLCEKKFNTAHVTRVFDSYEEAHYYQNKYMKYGGKIHVLQQTYKSTEKVSSSPLDFGIEDIEEQEKEITKLTYGKKIYLLIIEKKEALIGGYRYIKELIYDMMSIKMYDLFNEVVAKGIKPKGIKTDAILVSKSKSELEKSFLPSLLKWEASSLKVANNVLTRR